MKFGIDKDYFRRVQNRGRLENKKKFILHLEHFLAFQSVTKKNPSLARRGIMRISKQIRIPREIWNR